MEFIIDTNACTSSPGRSPAQTPTWSPMMSPFNPMSPCTPATPAVNPPPSTFTFQLKQSITESCNDDELNMASPILPSSPACSDDIKEEIPTKPKLQLSLSDVEDDNILFRRGYKKIRKIGNTLQGTLYEGIILSDHSNQKTIGIDRICIKQIPKNLADSFEAIQDEMTIVVDEDIMKEALILKYLTSDNKPNGGYITKYIDFIDSKHDYYLITEYVGDYSLYNFVNEAHRYIKEGKLTIAKWRKIVKYLFWQIAVTVNWLHSDMNAVHLDLNLDNIVLRDGIFIHSADGLSVSIHPNICVKLVDFGLSEVYQSTKNDNSFESTKWIRMNQSNEYHFISPSRYNEEVFDSKAEDIWSLGCILYYMSTGTYLYNVPDHEFDSGFFCIKSQKITKYLSKYNLVQYVNNKMLSLIYSMLNVNENKRITIQNILQCQWLNSYYLKYQSRIEKKSKSQININQIQQQMMLKKGFPFYKLNIAFSNRGRCN